MKQPNPQAVLILCALLFLIFWPLLPGGSEIHHRVIGMACFHGALALSWNIYALTGALSIGHAAFFGLGSYACALASHYWNLSPYVTILLGGLAGAVYGLVWSIAFRHLRGARLALATLASVEIPRVIIDNWDGLTFGSLGLAGIQSLPSLQLGDTVVDLGENLKAQYYFLLFFMLLVGFIHWGAIRSRWGWAVRSVREDETAASSLGVDVHGTRSRALLLSAFLTGVCGSIYAHLLGLIEPTLVFSLHISALPLVLSIFGGRYQSYGPIVGALILYPLDQLLFHSWLPAGHAALYGLVVIGALLFFPHGLGAWLQQRLRSA